MPRIASCTTSSALDFAAVFLACEQALFLAGIVKSVRARGTREEMRRRGRGTVCCQRFKHRPIVFLIVRATHNSFALGVGAVSLFSSWAAVLASRALSSLNLKKKRDCSQSTCLLSGDSVYRESKSFAQRDKDVDCPWKAPNTSTLIIDQKSRRN